METLLRDLFKALHGRARPEDVAKLILDARPGNYHGTNLATLKRAALHGGRFSYMATSFAKEVGLDKQIKIAQGLFPDVPVPADMTTEAEISAYLDLLRTRMNVGPDVDFKSKPTHEQRQQAKVPWTGHRAYNKRFRFVTRLAEKFPTWTNNKTMKDLAHIAKSRLVTRVTYEMLAQDLDTACFLTYMAAKLNVRSLFTWGKQPRAYDDVADMLFRQLGPSANWLAIAYVHPDTAVIEKLSEEAKGRLLGVWFDVMHTAAKILGREAAKGGVDLTGLVVRRGNDSSTWNEAAGAFNKARDGWINTLYAIGASDVLNRFAPPKGLRLMAADVVYMHRSYGSGGLEPDTKVWGELPKLWDVMTGKATCTRMDIEAACTRHGVEGKGWIAPREKHVAAFRPTPDLVHGVVVSSPALAEALYRCGAFSGPSKGLRGPVPDGWEKSPSGDVMTVNPSFTP